MYRPANASANHADVPLSEPLLTQVQDLTWERVLEEEQFYLEQRRLACGISDGDLHFSVAFSGGGVRAAAFQAGVLWRLAESGLIKHVDYFVGVSGGAYISSAFVSHVMQSGAPEKGEHLSSWYRRLITGTLLRFQDNVGYLVRDPCWKSPRSFPGSGRMPRSFDCPLLLLVTLFTLLVKPVSFLLLTVVPLVEGVQLFFGLAMRHSFCSINVSSAWDTLSLWRPQQVSIYKDLVHFWSVGYGFRLGGDYSPWDVCWLLVAIGFITVFLLWILKQLFPERKAVAGRAMPHLLIHSMFGALSRLVCFGVFALVLIVAVMTVQLWEWNHSGSLREAKGALCGQWILKESGVHNISGSITVPNSCPGLILCGDLRPGGPWYNNVDRQRREDLFRTSWDVARSEHIHAEKIATTGLLGFSLSMWFLGAAVAVLLSPFFPQLFSFVLYSAGPLITLNITGLLLQFRVFGVLTGQCIFASGGCWFHYDYWPPIVKCLLVLSLLVIPFYQNIHRPMHTYYFTSLRKAFFDEGKDWTMGELKENLYCPLHMNTATSHDFRRPWSTSWINEVSFTALHTGSEVTGYIRTPTHQKLSKTIALGSGATDAQVLGKMDTVTCRVLLQALNLRMGDFLLFKVAAGGVLERLTKHIPGFNPRFAWNFRNRFPSITLTWLGYALMFWALFGFVGSPDSRCRRARFLFLFGVFILLSLFILSFFGHIATLFSIAPGFREIQIATRFCHKSDDIPTILYLTDGGLQDCTGLVQLMRRRCKLIFMVIGFEDPRDELNQLRDAMRIANETRIGSFFDADQPKRDVKIALDSLPTFNGTFMRLGIRYGWDSDEANAEYAELIIVKNRLQDAWSWLDARIPPFLSEAEVAGTGGPAAADAYWKRLSQKDLAGCCCNCCHFNRCNIGPRFPHIHTGVQCISPQHFNCLCRLGYTLSSEAVQVILDRRINTPSV